MNTTCVHSCKGACNALEAAEQHERRAIEEYRRFAEGCDFPEVREILETLAQDRERCLRQLREHREALQARFSTLDSINESFT
jgi:rubrerythrin